MYEDAIIFFRGRGIYGRLAHPSPSNILSQWWVFHMLVIEWQNLTSQSPLQPDFCMCPPPTGDIEGESKCHETGCGAVPSATHRQEGALGSAAVVAHVQLSSVYSGWHWGWEGPLAAVKWLRSELDLPDFKECSFLEHLSHTRHCLGTVRCH